MNDIIALYEYVEFHPDNNMGYYTEFKKCIYLKGNGELGSLNKEETKELYRSTITMVNGLWVEYCSAPTWEFGSYVYVRKDYKEMFEKYRKPGRGYSNILKRMKEEIYVEEEEL